MFCVDLPPNMFFNVFARSRGCILSSFILIVVVLGIYDVDNDGDILWLFCEYLAFLISSPSVIFLGIIDSLKILLSNLISSNLLFIDDLVECISCCDGSGDNIFLLIVVVAILIVSNSSKLILRCLELLELFKHLLSMYVCIFCDTESWFLSLREHISS